MKTPFQKFHSVRSLLGRVLVLTASLFLLANVVESRERHALALKSRPQQPQVVATGPKVWLADRQNVSVAHVGVDANAQGLAHSLVSGQGSPLAMIRGDFDGDGVEDLAIGYATPAGAALVLHRGNLDAFAPQSDASFQAIARGEFPAPFLPQAQVYGIPVQPDFIAAGDFSGSGHLDILIASRGGNSLYLLPNLGAGKFGKPQQIQVTGGITALAAENMGNGASLTNALVGVSNPSGTFSLLLLGQMQLGLGALASFPLPGAASNIQFGRFDNAGFGAAFIAGGNVMILHTASMQMETVSLPLTATGLALGSFVSDRYPGAQLAVVDPAGNVHIAVHSQFDPRAYTLDELKQIRYAVLHHQPHPFLDPAQVNTGWKIVERFPSAAPPSGSAPLVMFKTRISSNGADDIMVLNGTAGQLTVISHPDPKLGASTFTAGEVSVRPYSGSPITALPMRTNIDGRPGVVALHQGETVPSTLMPLPDPTFTVNTTSDLVSGNPNACLNNVAGQCSLREAIIEANATAGTDTIMVPAGTYTLTIARSASPVYDARTGTLDVTDSVNIIGAGQASTIIQGGTVGVPGSPNGVDKVFSFNQDITAFTNATVSISGLTIQNGFNRGNTAITDGWGGAFDFDTGTSGNNTLTVTNVTLTNNTLTEGEGGGFAIFNTNNGTGFATFSSSLVQNNVTAPSSTGTAGNGGGGFVGTPAKVILNSTQILNNRANANAGINPVGGGLELIGPSGTPGQSAIHGSTISGNTAAGDGGGIWNTTNLLIDQGSVISNNLAGGNGGGLFHNALGSDTATLTKVTSTGNTATGNGGGIALVNGSGGVTLAVQFSRLAGNNAAVGKNLDNAGGTVTATNNWWGTNTPSNTINTGGGFTTTFDPFIVLTHTASPNKIRINQSATLTGDMSKDNHGSGAALAGNLIEIFGVAITFNNPILGTIPQAQPESLSASAQATATYNAGGTSGNGSADAIVDQQTVTASIIVLQPPSISKGFSPATVPANTPSTITFSITNANTVAINASFTDNLPANLVVATTPNVVNSCGGSVTATAGSSSISFSNPAALAVGTCTVKVDVQSAVDNNYSNNVTIDSTDAGNGNTAVANLTVINPPTILKSFLPTSIPFGGTTSLSFSVRNPNLNQTLSGVGFTDSLPAGLVVATPNGLGSSCGGTVTAVPGSSSVSLVGASLGTTVTCALGVNVQGTAVGLMNNSVTVSDTIAGTGNTSSASLTVTKSNSTTTVTSSVNPSVFGQSVTFTATVSAAGGGAGTATGTVTFLDGGSPIGTGTLSGGIATFTISALAVGNHTITTNYGGDANFNGSTGSLTGNPQVVNKADTATNVTSSVNPSVFGQSVTFTATVSPVAPGAGTPVGTVTFLDGGSPIGTGTLSGGIATFSTSALAVGNHTITTNYGGDGNFNGSTGALTGNPQVVNKANTATTVTSSANPSVFGQSVTFTATVSPVAPGAGTPVGTVTFLDGGSPIGTGTLSGGIATFTTSALAIGNHTITSNYGGDGNFNGNTGSLTGNPQVVNKTDSTTTVTSSLNPSIFGQSVTFTATVSPVAPGAGTPTGTVTFLDGGSPIGTGTMSGGIATFTTSALAVGNHTMTTSYGGDGNFNGSTGSLTGNPQVVNKTNTVTTVTSSLNPSIFGQSVTFTATVSPVAPGAGTPTGTVTFLDGGSPIGTGTMSGGIATFTTSALAVGNHTMTTSYGGDGNFNGSTGSLTGNPQVVNKTNTVTTVTSSVNPSASGQSVTFTATVSPVAPGAGTPTGTVTFQDGGSPIGNGTLSGGIATFTTSALAVGNHTITTNYAGDGNFNGSTASLTGNPQVVITPPSIVKVFGAATIPVNSVTSLTFTITNPAANPVALTGVAFTDNFPAGMVVASPNGLTGSCGGGTIIATPGAGFVTLAGATLAANGNCTFSLNVTSTTTGVKNNSVTVTSTNGGTGNTSNASVTVNALPATHFAVSAPATATAGTAFNFTVTALDTNNQTATTYAGTVHFTSSDGAATLPANVTLTNGVGTFSATLKTAGNQTITATDTVTSSITGTSNTIAVSAAAATHFAVLAPATAISGTALNFTVTALDQFNNTAIGYAGTAHFTSSDGAAALPASSTLTNGVGTFSATLNTGGNQTITATDTVTASITGTSNAIAVTALPATHFVVSAPATATSGTAFNFTVTALDTNNHTATNYAGTVHFTSTDGAATLPANSVLTNGVGTFSATLKTAGNQTITATDTVTTSITGTSNTIAVSAAAATHFTVSAPGTASSGVAFSITVTALDQFNNTATAYAGTVHFTSTDGAAVLPVNSTLTNGAGTFSATLNTGGNQTITATDTVTASITGTSNTIAVTALPATHFVVSAPATATAGTAFNFTVTALDANNHTANNYAGTVHFAGTDGAATLPANSVLTNGVGTFSATLKTAGSQTITATDSVTASITGTSNAITVSPAAATHFVVSAPATASSATPFNFTVTALDQFNNTATAYAGTVHFTSTDGTAILAANSTLTNGAGTFSATLNTGGNQTITATDTVTASITGTSNVIVVTVLPATHFVVSAPATATAGTAFNFTVTALDANNHTVLSYAGTVHFTSTDGAATLPANSVLTNGVGTFSATLKTAGSQTITATDSVTATVTGTSNAITVSAAAATHFTVSAPATASSGVAFNFTVTALDQFNNTAATYAGMVHFTSTDGAAVLPANSALTNGVGTFAATLKTAGNQTITATDSVTASITGTSNTIAVAPPADLTITKSHSGNFFQGQTGATYTLTVNNIAANATLGAVNVVDTLPPGLTATAMAGTGWTCNLAALSCTRSDVLAGGASYPAITVTVSVASNAPASVTNTAVVSGGGELNTANDTATDVTTITPPPDFAISSSPTVITVKAGAKADYTLTLTPQNAPFTNPIALSVTGLPAKTTFVLDSASVTPGANPATDSLIILTTADDPFLASNSTKGNGVFYATAGLPLIGLILSGFGFRRRKGKAGLERWSLVVIMLVCCGFGLYGCAGGSKNFRNLGTPPGTYTITVTGTSGALQHSTTVTLTVTP